MSLAPPPWLSDLGIPSGCITNNTRIEENNRIFGIQKGKNDQVWCVHVDDCWLKSADGKKVDYLFFWKQNGSARWKIILVELKGRDFGGALLQIQSILSRLCKTGPGNGIHRGNVYQLCGGHLPVTRFGVRAFVVLTNGNEVSLRQREREQIRKRYNVLVYTKTKQLDISS